MHRNRPPSTYICTERGGTENANFGGNSTSYILRACSSARPAARSVNPSRPLEETPNPGFLLESLGHDGTPEALLRLPQRCVWGNAGDVPVSCATAEWLLLRLWRWRAGTSTMNSPIRVCSRVTGVPEDVSAKQRSYQPALVEWHRQPVLGSLLG